MTIIYPLDLPSLAPTGKSLLLQDDRVVALRAASFIPSEAQLVSESITGQVKAYATGGSRWRGSYSFNQFGYKQKREWLTFFRSLRGQIGSFYATDPLYRQAGTAVDGDGQAIPSFIGLDEVRLGIKGQGLLKTYTIVPGESGVTAGYLVGNFGSIDSSQIEFPEGGTQNITRITASHSTTPSQSFARTITAGQQTVSDGIEYGYSLADGLGSISDGDFVFNGETHTIRELIYKTFTAGGSEFRFVVSGDLNLNADAFLDIGGEVLDVSDATRSSNTPTDTLVMTVGASSSGTLIGYSSLSGITFGALSPDTFIFDGTTNRVRVLDSVSTALFISVTPVTFAPTGNEGFSVLGKDFVFSSVGRSVSGSRVNYQFASGANIFSGLEGQDLNVGFGTLPFYTQYLWPTPSSNPFTDGADADVSLACCFLESVVLSFSTSDNFDSLDVGDILRFSNGLELVLTQGSSNASTNSITFLGSLVSGFSTPFYANGVLKPSEQIQYSTPFADIDANDNFLVAGDRFMLNERLCEVLDAELDISATPRTLLLTITPSFDSIPSELVFSLSPLRVKAKLATPQPPTAIEDPRGYIWQIGNFLWVEDTT